MSLTIAIPLAFLFLGILSFWILVESNISYIAKVCMITLFCAFVTVFLFSLHSYLGWSALEKDLPERVTIMAVEIKEPNPNINEKGRIYLLLDSIKSRYDKRSMEMFGFKNEKAEPRLFSVPYNRNLHESLQKNVIPKLKQGQKVTGRLKKGNGSGEGDGEGGDGNGKGGKGKGKGQGNGSGKEGKGNGQGSESQEQDYMFYNLPPSELNPKK